LLARPVVRAIDAPVAPTSEDERGRALGIPYNVAIVDAGGHLIAFSRQDGALIGSIDPTINKAYTVQHGPADRRFVHSSGNKA